ncbi:MAG: hypothetical protein R3B70_29835 [Polyangiaceae bacterium]
MGAAPTLATVTTFDSLGRAVRIDDPDGAITTFAHSMFETTTTDPEGRMHHLRLRRRRAPRRDRPPLLRHEPRRRHHGLRIRPSRSQHEDHMARRLPELRHRAQLRRDEPSRVDPLSTGPRP